MRSSTRQRAAFWTLRLIGGLLLLGATLSLFTLFFAGASEAILVLLDAAILGWIGLGLVRGKEGAWMTVMIVGGMFASFQLALFAGTRDPIAGLSFLFNGGIVAALIWAGRNHPAPAGEPPLAPA